MKYLIPVLIFITFFHADGGEAIMIPDPAVVKELPADGGDNFNRLVFEKSPYLLQHAGNPVDWYPWGDEAFAKAAKEDRPIFLSIGYSTCHWCHVMERESFENEEVARILNRHFVSIKVDREERPDIDNIYMTVCQAMTGSGGWPLTILMTPDKKPFFAGTYFPAESRYGRPGLTDLLINASRLWNEKRDSLLDSAAQVTDALQKMTTHESGELPGEETLKAAYENLSRRFDKTYGGFGAKPKFPMPHQLRFLLRYGKNTGEKNALDMVEHTLTALRKGGIFDHIGFGFHRYSTDREFLVPHFEKMLYDQAGLALAYTEAYQATGSRTFKQTAMDIFSYVLLEMTGPHGGFYSAQDADSEGVEGKFYVWSHDEVMQVLGEKEGKAFSKALNIEPGGNFQDEATGRDTGLNIPHITAESPEGVLSESVRKKLLSHRNKRVPPLKDDKVLTSWNGMMIAALAKAGRVMGEPSYIEAAAGAADFVLEKMRDRKGRLLRRFRQGEGALPAYLDDYAFFVWGLLELYESGFEVRYLREAIALNRDMIKIFEDREQGGFFFSGRGNEELLTRMKESYDGAIPAGNSVAMLNLLRIGRITADPELEKKAEAVARAFAKEISHAPEAHAQLLMAVDFIKSGSREIVIAGRPGSADSKAMLDAVNSVFLPNKVLIFHPQGEGVAEIESIAGYVKYQGAIDGKATAYVCENFKCKKPVTSPEDLKELL